MRNYLFNLFGFINRVRYVLILLLFVSVFLDSKADIDFTKDENFKVSFECSSKMLLVEFRMRDNGNSGDDAWTDSGDHPTILTLNGVEMFRQWYKNVSGENGYPYRNVRAQGVTYEPTDELLYAEVRIPMQHFVNGTNSINLSGIWQDRVVGGDDKYYHKNDTRTITLYKPEPVTDMGAVIDNSGMVTLTFVNPDTDLQVRITQEGRSDVDLSGSTEQWTDNQSNTDAKPYKIYTFASIGGCEVLSSPSMVTPPLPPRISAPTGFRAEIKKCEGKVNLMWDHDGDVASSGFELYKDDNKLTDLNAYQKSYEDNIGDFASATYKVLAKGPLGDSDFSPVLNVETQGFPVAATSFSVTESNGTFRLTWDVSDVTGTDKFVIKRNSLAGEKQFIIKDVSTRELIDNQVNSCEEYRYEIFSVNGCTSENGLEGISGGSDTKKIRPIISSYIESFSASKSYYADQVKLEWTVLNDNVDLVDKFEVYRKAKSESQFKMIGTVSSASSYNDLTAEGGIMYQYKVKAKLKCEGEELTSNELSDIGFRLPYGMVIGHIEYESGVAVKGVTVMAEKDSGVPTGYSLKFNGSSRVDIANSSVLNPNKFITAEAWVKPESLSGIKSIIDKSGGTNYKLYQSGDDVRFDVGGSTVYANDVLKTDRFTHIAGVVDSTGIKIYVNGKIPIDVTYNLTDSKLQDLTDMSISEDIVEKLNAIKGQTYNDLESFKTAISGSIGESEAEPLYPFIIPIAKIENYKSGSVIRNKNVSISTSSGNLSIGNGFSGYIDEVRIWNVSKDSKQIENDFKRIVGNDEKGIAGYWRFEENFEKSVYDVSKSNGEFHKNDGSWTSGVEWSTEIPLNTQLSWAGVTNANGDYTIPYIPYLGTGETFIVTPIYEQHVFQPATSTIYLGDGANIASNQNFIDKSSFKVTGTVFYDGTTCGVEAAIVAVDGEPVIKDGTVVMTNQNGEFEISVPVGNHFVSVQKSQHKFKSFKFPPGENTRFDFQEDISGINFIDTTKVKVVGRIVGGTIEGNKKPGLGLSKNNIGVGSFTFESTTGCSSYNIVTSSKTGEYTVELPPMKYKIKNFAIPKNLKAEQFFSEFEVADFSVVGSKIDVDYTYTGAVDAKITIDKSAKTATLDIWSEDDLIVLDVEILQPGTSFEKARFSYNEKTYEYALDTDNITVLNKKIETNTKTVSTSYNYQHDFIYRSVPVVLVTKDDGVTPISGDKKVSFEDRVSKRPQTIDLGANPFLYPVFTQGKRYKVLISVEEEYFNQDMCSGINGCDEAIRSVVPVNDGTIVINNQLAAIVTPSPLTIVEGKAIYEFNGGKPQFKRDGNFSYRNYTGVMNITADINGKGYEWFASDDMSKLKEDRYFRGYVLGARAVQGSDFITEGPSLVDMILRDPPGSESYSYISKGSTFSTVEAFSISGGTSESSEAKVSLGTEFTIGLGFETETSITADYTTGLSKSTTRTSEGELQHDVTIEESWQTSDSPELAGPGSDLFFGSSTNYVVSLADNLTIFKKEFATNNGIDVAESVNAETKYVIGQNKSLMAAPTGESTHFIYTSDHIENYLIPFLTNIRNNLFVEKANKYKSNVAASHDMFGANNDDPKWKEYNKTPTSENYITTEPGLDYDGPGYTFTPADDKDRDEIRKYNEQIRLWQEALARNEMEKYGSTIIKNISFDAGPTFEHSTTTSISESHTSTFELEINEATQIGLGVEIGGAGFEGSLGFEVNRTSGKSNTTSSELSNTFGYVLHDPDQGDYFSVDVKDPGTGTGPVFSTKGGRSMCPHEDKVEVKYYKPASHNITEEVITKLRTLGVKEELLTILAIEDRGKKTVNEVNTLLGLNISSGILDLVGNEKVDISKIKEQIFSKTYKVKESIYKNTDLNTDVNVTVIINEALNIKEDVSLLSYIGEVDGLTDHIETTTGGSRFYLITEEKRNDIKQEFLKYRQFIYDLSAKYISNPDLLSEATIRREVPTASITPSVLYDVPDDNKAYFNVQFGNESGSGDAMWYEARVLEESNPHGAIIMIDGVPIERSYEIPAGQFINKTITVQKGKDDVYHYDNLQVALYSPCEWEFHTNGMSMPKEAIDTVTFSVHFVPACTDINVYRPGNQFIVNANDEVLVDGVLTTKVPIVLNDYNLNNSILDKISFQYKSAAETDWTTTTPFYKGEVTGDSLEIEGAFTGLEWNLSGFPDGQYQIRAKSYCGRSQTGSEIFDLSEVWSGTVDRKSPKVFGSPQPADGILSPDDDITIEFNETIYGEKLTNLANFDIRGVLNGTDIRHDASVRFDNDASQFVRIPDGLDVSRKSFTVEFWVRPERAFVDECILSQNSDPNNAIYIGLNSANKFDFRVGDETFEVDGLNVSELTEKWTHMAFVYDNIRDEVIVYKDGVYVASKDMLVEYTGFGDLFIGKSLSGDARPFQGSLHELRIWERPRTASKLASNMLVSLSGKETGMLGYWPLDEAFGTIAVDRVKRRDASVNTDWRIYPSGYANRFIAAQQGAISMDYSDIAFSEEQDFTIEFWFKSDNGSNVSFFSNGHGDYKDKVVYYISPEAIHKIVNVLPLVEDAETKLTPMKGKLFADSTAFIDEVKVTLGNDVTEKYQEQILRFSKINPTYWCINTDASGNIQVNNNSKRIKAETSEAFDNKWHHFALVVERVGNSRIYLDGELKTSQPSTEWSGFGGAKVFIGARALWNNDYILDQYFNGSMDELRVWNTALKQSQISRNSNIRLDGDELGLVSYMPFESYEEVMGIPTVAGEVKDIMSAGRTISTQGIDTNKEEVPNVRMKRPSSKVDFEFTAKKDKIAFTINEPTAKIENCILDITAKNVEDMFGNKMESPVTWSAYIDMNQTKWMQQNISLSKLVYDTLTFKATINNASGRQQNFSIENIPVWLTAETSEGTIEPLSKQTITFTVNEATNVGYYVQNIGLKTDFEFEEKLQVDLRVFKESPVDWSVDPGKYQYSMNLMGYLVVNNVASVDKYDKVAAFIGDECVGVSTVEYVQAYDRYMVFMDIYSNKAQGDNVYLKVWDASEGQIISNVDPKFVFDKNTVKGIPSAPTRIEALDIYEREIEFNAGWTWVSFNLDPIHKSDLNKLFKDITTTDKDEIKTLGGFGKYSEQNKVWTKRMDDIQSGVLYKIKNQAGSRFVYEGTKSSVDKPIQIVKDWNWIGYVPQFNVSVTEAFSGLNPNHNDIIKGQSAFALYDDQLGWIGSLKYLTPDRGYLYKSTLDTPREFKYPEKTTLKSSFAEPQNIGALAFNKYSYQHSMSMVAELAEHSAVDVSNLIVVAYVNGKIRGYSEIVRANNKDCHFLSVFGSGSEGKIEFKAYDAVTDKFYNLVENLDYNLSNVVGSHTAPVKLTLSDIVSSVDDDTKDGVYCYPNPFTDKVKIVVNGKLPQRISIYDVNGKLITEINTVEGTTEYFWHPAYELPAGVYQVKLGNRTESISIIKRK